MVAATTRASMKHSIVTQNGGGRHPRQMFQEYCG
jgi:hypothetical protein